ncbi:MAG: hypothetical protein SGILL_004307, partial [Bacillariaceae sp.]
VGGESDTDLGLSLNAVPVKIQMNGGGMESVRSQLAGSLQGNDLTSYSSLQKGLRLWVQATKEEVNDKNLSKVLSKYYNGLRSVVLVYTINDEKLSDEASAGEPLQRFGIAPVTELPFGLGHILAFVRGKHLILPRNAYDNLFRGREEKTVRIRQFPYKADDVLLKKRLQIDYAPHGDEGKVLSTDAEIVAELARRQEDFPKEWNSFKERKIQFFAGKGLFTDSTNNDTWQTAHGILPKYFNAIRIKNYYPIILEKTQHFVQEWIKMGHNSKIEDVSDWLTCMTADAIVKASMDFDMRNVERKGAGEELHGFLISFRIALGRLMKGADQNDEEYAKSVKACQDIVSDIVERTRAGEIGGSLSFVTGMLESKSNANGEFIRMEDFWGHCINVMVAGHETTAATLGFCMAELAQKPECLKKALKEIEDVLGSRSSPTYEDICNLKYLEACFKETLRMYPPVGFLARECATDTIVKGNHLLRKGQRVETLVCGLHRDPEQWDQGIFGDPAVFNPERHMPGAPPRHPNAMAPFGFGVRACIGYQFAMLESKVFLAMVLNFFTLDTPKDFEVVPVRHGGAPVCKDLTFNLRYREGGPLSKINVFSDCESGTCSPIAVSTPNGASSAPTSPSVRAAKKPLLILYGSNTGSCEDFGRSLHERSIEEGYESKVMTLDKAIADNLLPFQEGPVAIITCTYNGNPPDNATKFSKWIASLENNSIGGMKFAVFGVGNSNWVATYQKFPKDVQSGLLRGGAQMLKDIATADMTGADAIGEFEEWADNFLKVIGLDFGVAGPLAQVSPKNRATYIRKASDTSKTAEPATNGFEFREKFFDALRPYKEQNGSFVDESKYQICKVKKFQQLQSEDSNRSTCHVELSLPDGMSYEAGDHLSVVPCNSDKLVEAALSILGMKGDEVVDCNPGRTAFLRGLPDDLPGVPITSRMALKWLPDLLAAPSRKQIQALAETCPCPPEAAQLRKLSEEGEYKEKVVKSGLTTLALLSQYRSVIVDIVQLSTLLPRLKARFYSISSSPKVEKNRIAITVALVDYDTKSGHRQGVASSMIHSMEEGSYMLCGIQQLGRDFKLPEDPSTPIIMVGPGTGLAPFMGFMEERDVLAKKNRKDLGEAHLFFGCRSSAQDFIYKERLEEYSNTGVLSSDGLHVAFSREVGQSKLYVQDLIAEHGREMWNLIYNSDATVFICGDALRMAPDVKKTFLDLACKYGQMSSAAAENWMGSLIGSGRYVEEVYA